MENSYTLTITKDPSTEIEEDIIMDANNFYNCSDFCGYSLPEIFSTNIKYVFIKEPKDNSDVYHKLNYSL